jgi:arginase
MSSNLSFIINKSELGAGTRGASLGPEAIQVVARQKKSKLFSTHPTKVLPHLNDLLDGPTDHVYAKYIEGMQKVYDTVAENVKKSFEQSQFPFLLSGDHCSAGGTIKGIKEAFPTASLGVIWIDAHADLHTPLTSPSGNLHGMPLATALGVENEEMKKNKVPENTIQLWNSLKTNFVSPECLIFIGVRDTEPEEDFLISKLGIKNYSVNELTQRGIQETLIEIHDRLKKCDLIYVSFDVDSMDPDETSYGTGTPVENGLSVSQAESLLQGLMDSPKTAIMEFVEVNPCLDEKVNKMAEVAFSLVQKLSLSKRFAQ